ncbi:hypothetical protein OUZ56_002875 [Daphnia magna]|uniref:Secreted protein n=1 Tax=Daphnia magna TaxID=35525 RepID=A0ABR0A7I3_9CRUS|nr:hypothetical protein OUZ56_002875 [Daphnia magna]
MCFKEFFVKTFTIAFCLCWCFALSAMLAAKPAACIPAINVPQEILTLLEGTYCLHEDHHPVQHPRYPDFQVSLISQPSSKPFSSSMCQLTWIGFDRISIFWTANIHLPSVRHCRFDNFGSFSPSGPHATTFSSASCRYCLRLHLIAVFVDVFAFISVSSS